jgi:transposase InsO family protein
MGYGVFFVSFFSVYRILCSYNLIALRGIQKQHNGHALPQARKEIDGPNKLWRWDISYFLTYESGVFLYLYLLLDEYSRKFILWLISWHQNAEDARRLLEDGLINENILLSGFGKFCVKEKLERRGLNFQTGNDLMVD